MKTKILTTVLTTIMFAGCASTPTAEPVDKLAQEEERMALQAHVDDVAKVSPSHAEIGMYLTTLLVNECDMPENTETFDRIVREEPVFLLNTVAIRMFNENETLISQFKKSVESTVDCDDMQGWPERIRNDWSS